MSVTIEYAIFKLHEAGKDICVGCKFFNWKSDLCEKLLSFPKKSRQVNTIFPKKVDSFLKT